MHKIIIDTDPGIDDAQAIAFAALHPQIELLGLTTIFGNGPIEKTTSNALRFLELLDSNHIPVAQGAGEPLSQPRFPAPDFVHGKDVFGNVNLSPPTSSTSNLTGAEFIVEKANELNGELSIVAIGPLTNLALALRLDSSLPKKVKEVIIMGGTVIEPGNVTPVAEANFINDPHAADQVLAADWPVTIIGLDVTHQTLIRESDLKNLNTGHIELDRFLWSSCQHYFKFYREALGLSEGSESQAPMHDASALVYVVARESFECITGPACVITDGPAKGQLALDRKGHEYVLDYWANRPAIETAMKVDAQHIKQVFLNTLNGS